jgi:hypothetical protein
VFHESIKCQDSGLGEVASRESQVAEC